MSGSFDKTVRVWDVATGKERLTLRGHPSLIDFATVTPDGKTAVSADQAGTVKFWDVASGRERLSQKTPGRLESMALLPDGRTLLLQWGEHTFERWDAATGDKLPSVKHEPDLVSRPDGDPLPVFEYSPDRKTAVVAAPRVQGFDGIGLWDMVAGQLRASPKIGTYALSVVACHPGGRIFVVGHAKGHEAISLLHVATGEPWFELRGANHNESCFTAVFTRDGNVLATAEGPDSQIRLWDASLFWKAKPPGKNSLSAGDLPARWADLASDDAARAHRALWDLAGAPEQAVPWLSTRLRPVAAADQKTTARLIAELDGVQFSMREEASRALRELGDKARPALRKALTTPLSPEARRRVDALLDELETLSPDRLRQLRAVEALEHAGTPEAAQVLEILAGGVAEARFTREANASLNRLMRR